MGIQKRKFQTLPRENKELGLKEFHQAKKKKKRKRKKEQLKQREKHTNRHKSITEARHT